MEDRKAMPTLDDFCKELEQIGEAAPSNRLRQAAAASRLMNPFLEGPLPKEMDEKLTVFRKAEIEHCIVCDTAEDIL